MATTKINATKSTSRAINYAEKRAVRKDGHQCDIDYAKSSFKATRELYGKTGGNEGHIVIQSFQPGEVDADQCNQLGLELAQKIAPNHQVAVYTHDDKEHMHNHIVINAVDLETGNKFVNQKKTLHDIRRANDDICREHGLTIAEEGKAPLRYTQAEQHLIAKGQSSWKDELREHIEEAKSHTGNREAFQEHLEGLGVQVKERSKNISYKHPEASVWVRGKTLGADYDKEAINREFTKQQQPVQQSGYLDTLTIDWEAFERITKERKNQRTRTTEQAAGRSHDRTRETGREPKPTHQRPHRKANQRNNGLSL